MTRAVRRLALLLLFGWTLPAHAQFAALVYDPTNFGANIVTSVQSVITATEAVLQTANMVLELTPVEEIIVGGQIAEDLAILGEIISSAELVWFDLQSLESQITALFGLENVPLTREGLDERLLEIKQFYYRTLSYAMRTQTLVMTMFRTVEHVSALIASIGSFVGNMSANQTLVQVNTTVSKTLAVMEVQQSAWQRADTVQRLSEGIVLESMRQINLARLEDHPRN
jgi:conjugal transfer/entry exclusion protein